MVEIILHPCDKVVLERALDELVKEVGCEKFVNISAGEVASKWL